MEKPLAAIPLRIGIWYSITGQESMVTIDRWKVKAKALKRETYALYLCSRHPETPIYAKAFALLILAYAMSPIDLIPDFIPVLGYVDDLVLIPLGIALLIKMMPKEVLAECRERAESLSLGKARRWAGAARVVCVWIFAVLLFFRFMVPVIWD